MPRERTIFFIRNDAFAVSSPSSLPHLGPLLGSCNDYRAVSVSRFCSKNGLSRSRFCIRTSENCDRRHFAFQFIFIFPMCLNSQTGIILGRGRDMLNTRVEFTRATDRHSRSKIGAIRSRWFREFNHCCRGEIIIIIKYIYIKAVGITKRKSKRYENLSSMTNKWQ